jgi:hypothetical protein
MTLNITTFSMTLRTKGVFVTLSKTMLCQYTECHSDECYILFIVVLNVVMLSVFMLNAIMLSVVMLNVIILSAMAPGLALVLVICKLDPK